MGVEPPPKYVNRELNSQIGIRSQDSHFSESDGAPPTSMLLWGATYCVKYVKCDANDSLCTTWFVVAAGCGTAALAITAQIQTDATQHVIHIKIYILAQLYHKRQHRLIYVHIQHKKSNSTIISQFRVLCDYQIFHLANTNTHRIGHEAQLLTMT